MVPRALWGAGLRGDTSAYVQMAVARAWAEADRFDVIHSHVEHAGLLMARYCRTPVVSTMHRRLDVGGLVQYLDLVAEVPLIAISESQRRWNPDANWVATIHHGLDFSSTPSSTESGDYLLLVGRVSREKGVTEAIEVARRTQRRLVMAAKVHEREEQLMFEEVVRPAIDDGTVDWRGEVTGEERDRLMAKAYATLMLGGWPEPFGLVAIESMATGTPVIARRAGGVTETVDHGASGYLVDDIDEAVLAVALVERLSRQRVAAYARDRFSARRMTTLYELAYGEVLQERRAQSQPLRETGAELPLNPVSTVVPASGPIGRATGPSTRPNSPHPRRRRHAHAPIAHAAIGSFGERPEARALQHR